MNSALYLLYVFGSIVGGLLLMWPLAALFGANNWPIFHSWGLMHGAFMIAWPVLSGLTFVVLRFLLVPAAQAMFRGARADHSSRERDDA